MDGTITITCWGSRGSFPAPYKDRMKYGGNTSCFVIETGDSLFVLDAGTGMAAFGQELVATGHREDGSLTGKDIHIFISHIHLDHVAGIPFFKPLYENGYRIHFYGEERRGRTLREQLENLCSPPYWPVALKTCPSLAGFHTIQAGQSLIYQQGTVLRTMRANHPDQTTLFSFLIGKRKIIYGLDCELSDSFSEKMSGFAEYADLIICDCQYAPREYPFHIGWGHSSWKQWTELARKCHARQLWFAHYAWESEDSTLDELESQAQDEFPNCVYVREGMRIVLRDTQEAR